MYERVTLGVADRDASERFYRHVLTQLGYEPTDERDPVRTVWGDFAIVAAADPTQRLHVGLVAPSRTHVDGFWAAGVGAGHLRFTASDPADAAVLCGPDGNAITVTP